MSLDVCYAQVDVHRFDAIMMQSFITVAATCIGSLQKSSVRVVFIL